MDYLKLILKGFVVGLGKIIPGVSGGMLAMVLGIYEESVQAVAHFFKNFRKNILFLGALGIGIMLAIVFMSGVIDFSLEHYYLPTMLLFIGLMIGGSASLKREIEGFIKNLHSNGASAYAKYMGDAIFKIPTPLM
ncbi:MAG: DUF368 domain-containing protein, partial [Bacilli bacterium]|nr:DUF368 domain-containing protein [Bacilli bacterium]